MSGSIWRKSFSNIIKGMGTIMDIFGASGRPLYKFRKLKKGINSALNDDYNKVMGGLRKVLTDALKPEQLQPSPDDSLPDCFVCVMPDGKKFPAHKKSGSNNVFQVKSGSEIPEKFIAITPRGKKIIMYRV